MNFEERLNEIYTMPELPDELSEKYAIKSCLKYNDEKQVYLIKSKEDNKEYILKCAHNKYSELIHKEYEMLKKATNLINCPKPVSYITNNNVCFFIKEYVDGKTIKERVEDNVLSDQEIIDIILKLSLDIAKLHSLNPPIILRDIKPENIVDSHGEYIIIDFDASREYNETANSDTEYVGTRATAAPEQFGYSQTDARTDVYAIGMLMLYMKTGSFDRDMPTSSKLDKVIRKCIAFSPNERYSSIEELRKALEFKMRKSVIALVSVAVVIVLAVASAFFAVHYKNTSENRFTYTKQAKRFSDEMVSEALALIENQNHMDLPTENTEADLIEFILADSDYAVFGGKKWPSIATIDEQYYINQVNDSALTEIYGSYTLILDTNSSASMSVGWFVSGVVYSQDISLSSYRVYLEGEAGNYKLDELKEYFKLHLQAGEHLRIDETRSMSFISCDDEGFYFIEYASDNNYDNHLRLRYYSFEEFTEYLNALNKQMWYYEVNENLN